MRTGELAIIQIAGGKAMQHLFEGVSLRVPRGNSTPAN
jgi:hypothetical protein